MSAPRYATRRAFDGQRASLGRVIVQMVPVSTPGYVGALVASTIVGINDYDEPCVASASVGTMEPAGMFVETKTEADVLEMLPGSWTWPPRIGSTP